MAHWSTVDCEFDALFASIVRFSIRGLSKARCAVVLVPVPELSLDSIQSILVFPPGCQAAALGLCVFQDIALVLVNIAMCMCECLPACLPACLSVSACVCLPVCLSLPSVIALQHWILFQQRYSEKA